MATVQAHTHVLESQPIRESLAHSDFDFADLKNGRVTIYLILPADRLDTTFTRWLRLLIQQAITVNARNIEVKPAKSVLFLLDEMAALGRLEKVHQAFGLMRGFGMQLWGIVQDLSQLEENYGKGWQSFMANSGVLQYFGSRDEKTASYFSKLTGMATVQDTGWSFARGTSSSSGLQGGSSGSSTTETWTYSDKQRSLAFPDELMRLNGRSQLLIIENMNPIAADKTLWDEDGDLSSRGFNLHEAARGANDDAPELRSAAE
jgi:type IV secretion system protein VirD4